MTTAATALSVRGLAKTYPGTTALSGVDLDIAAGEIHALAGGNGSGKSTLVKVLAGVERADPGGTVTIGGQQFPADRLGPDLARAAGLRFVHQDAGVFEDMTVEENLALGRGYPTGAGGRVRWARLRARTAELIERYEIGALPSTRVGTLRPASRTMLAIARALQDCDDGTARRGVLVLDEPTAALPRHEAELLLSTLRRLAAAGWAVLFISHHLVETLHLVDRVSVLRDGRLAATADANDLDEQKLITLIVGRPLDRVFPDAADSVGDRPVLEVAGLSVGPLRDVSFTLAQGEVLGVAGLLGSGRSTLLRSLFGEVARSTGRVTLDGVPLRARTPAQAMAAGIAYVPEDRGRDAALPDLPLRENLSAATISVYWRALRMARRAERRDAGRLLHEFRVKAGSPEQPLATLSGGNQQKVILARWLRRDPRLLLLDEPTQGVDVGARADIYRTLRAAVDAGTSVLLVASDVEELARVSDRVLVLRGGRVAAQLRPPHLNPATLTELTYLTDKEPAR
ncbi:sugar ABC transporter ATP-binding protein [Parafrankia sp. EUN1f]|uniref:sugar ABC transporter ATP-binding protein n=1 Tax=Parafrankia sp. EUN1f TaxID=102897 RepID=UPI0001C45FA6|nr:sugar ABC transporter ATP-binding protein [Parafrankia sp. EUN1f]EFC81430.1 ABC transporter related protein [Parafrankia sp. EUN1f]